MEDNLKSSDISQIVKEAIENPIVRKLCTVNNTTNINEMKRAELEFCRVVGYCIL